MRDIPIIFSAPMVRALLEGRKTMTRRLAWRGALPIEFDNATAKFTPKPSPWQKVKPGDRLWVREAWAPVNSFYGPGWGYRADEAFIQPQYDGPDEGNGPSFNYDKYPGSYAMWFNDLLAGEPDHRWTPSIHMPRWASRLTLVVTATKIERLQDISIDDAWAEGIHRIGPFKEIGGDPTFLKNIAGVEDANRASTNFPCVLQAWRHLWVSINGEESWAANPEVVALTFTVHKTNIAKMKAAA